jgi:hypothetical protein
MWEGGLGVREFAILQIVLVLARAWRFESPNPYIVRDQLLAKRILDMMELSDEDRKLIERLAPMLEDSLKYKIVRSIIDALEETSYPPEEMMQEDFIRDIEEAENDIKEGKSNRYSYDTFKKQFSAKAD